jgi:hypothetical protein
MTALQWDQTGQRLYETGVDHGVLYMPDASGLYTNGVAWNGLTSVSETPTGAEANAQYADNIKYLNLISAEEFGATIEAFTYPDEFAPYDGLGVPVMGVTVGQQARKTFGLSYRSRLGNDVAGDDFGYKLHLVYGCQAAPSEKAYNTINDSPEAITFSWEVTTTPVGVEGHRPTSVLTIDSSKVGAAGLTQLEQLLYGSAGSDPTLPLPDSVISLFTGGAVLVTPTAPTYDQPTKTITVPGVVGVKYYVAGSEVMAGPLVITEDTVVTARPDSGYIFPAVSDDDWFFDYV